MKNFTIDDQKQIDRHLLYLDQQQQDDRSSQCRLQWRQGQLLVRLSQDLKQPYLPLLENQQWLVRCLKHSPVRLVRIDATLGEAELKRWANACKQAKKPVFLKGTAAQKLRQSKLRWGVKLIDWIAALLLLMVLSPVMLAIVLLQIYLSSPRAIFSREWRVGARGKLFQALRFRTTEIKNDSRTTLLGHWMCKYSLDKLPQLFNILGGEMSLLGPRSLDLSDAVRLSREERKPLKVVPWNGLAGGFVAEA